VTCRALVADGTIAREAGLHRARHSPAVGDPVELGRHGLLDEVGALLA